MAETAFNEFRTTLANFTGPLDLLLYLIRKNEIDILDIPIAEILVQYEEYVGLLRDIDVNLAADYLVMATTLMEIKSRMLLPRAPIEGEEEVLEDPRENLVRQLLEYREYKERALYLAEQLRENTRRFRRAWGDDSPAFDSVELGKVSVWDLVTAFLRIQKAIASDRAGDIVYAERPISFYMELIRESFARAGSDLVTFEEIFIGHGPVDRYILVGIFLAILELVKLGALGVAQREADGEIVVRLELPDLAGCMEALAEHRGLIAERGLHEEDKEPVAEEIAGEEADGCAGEEAPAIEAILEPAPSPEEASRPASSADPGRAGGETPGPFPEAEAGAQADCAGGGADGAAF